ncbi:MAG: GNAT family N-acetyltransferase [Pseudomonadaceae bacterium]|nr:GNAT family N-acetyltransferase [Pseudomonadaceae bacterium]
MIPVHSLGTLPDNWEDPILPAATAQALLMQPGHVLLTVKHPDRFHPPATHALVKVIAGEAADILTLYTPAAVRRCGLAKRLLEDVIVRAREAGCPAITLEVRRGNTAARALYHKLGFTEIATRPAYYTSPVEDAVVYSLPL